MSLVTNVSRTLLAAALLLPALLCAATSSATYKHLPATNPYQAALTRFLELPAAERDALARWAAPSEGPTAPSLTPAQQQLIAELRHALVAAAGKPPTTASDWPLVGDPTDPDNPLKITVPYAEALRPLASLVAKSADLLPSAEAIDTYAALAHFARQQRQSDVVILQLTGIGCENLALQAASRRLGEFSPTELQALAAAWARIPNPPSPEKAFAGERDRFYPYLLEKVVLPAFEALLAEENQAAHATDPEASTPAPDFTRDYRLSGLANLGREQYQITLENLRTGDSLTLVPNRAVEGITLLHIDFEHQLAVIRHADQDAVIHLKSKRIAMRSPAIQQLRQAIASGLIFPASTSDPDVILQKWWRLARAHPGGPQAYTEDFLAGLQTGLDAQLARAALPQAHDDTKAPRPSDPFLAAALPKLEKPARTLHIARTQATMLQSAIQLRLRQLGQTLPDAPPGDPFSSDGADFASVTTEDGGFLLRSRYESAPGQPLTYKFATPDAGFLRPSTPPDRK